MVYPIQTIELKAFWSKNEWKKLLILNCGFYKSDLHIYAAEPIE